MLSVTARLWEHHNEACRHFHEEQIVGLFLQGSQNYGLEIYSSDVDTKLVVVPSFYQIAMAIKPVSTTHIRENEEHIDFKDVRLMLQTFKKQNMNFVETLFTPYKILNPTYEEQWNRLVEKRELIARLSPWAAVKTMKGVALEKYHAMEHEYPSKLEVLRQYGYDPKQLHHLLRVKEFLVRYLDGEDYEKCLRPRDPEYLKAVKMGYFNLDQARVLATETADKVTTIVNAYCNTHEPTVIQEAVDLIDDVQYEIMKTAVEEELRLG